MQLLMKIALCIGGVLLIVGSTLVTTAALFPPKEHGGSDDERADGDKWDESIEDV